VAFIRSGSVISGNISWSNQYGLNWQLGGQISCDLNGDMYFNLYGKTYYFQQTGFSKVTINTTGIGIGITPTYPLHITTYVASTQTYRYFTYSSTGGPGTYTQNYSIYCSYAILGSEFNAISDSRIKTNIENIDSSIDIINKLRPVTFNYKNINKYGISQKYGLIAQEVKNIIPNVVNISYGVIDDINTEFNKNDIKIDNNKVTLPLNNFDIQQNDKLELCDIDDEGITNNIRTVDIIEVSNNEFSFIDTNIDSNKNIYISGKHTNDFHAIDYIGLIPILIKGIQELSGEITILKNRITILESKLVI